ncbi:glycogen debranching protein GlgX [Solimonas soli]|uniref:glycogen debranching protein GlgX n=1 Tax=Solimonas soli TaxID=413479 RepID=UPI000481C5E2|nr:glycogen debranching protein GlgX [Solimonas soli]
MLSDLPDRLLPPDPQHADGPLGAHWDGRGTHFAVFSESAELIELCLFDASGRHELRLPMPECVDGIWRGYLPNARPGQLYGYRAYGAYEPKAGKRFNPHKLLVDPYARQLAGELKWHDALYGYRLGSPRGDLSFDRRDSAAYVPKAIVVDDRFDWGDDHPPRVPWSQTTIYEMHVRGFSKRRDGLYDHDRGTFGALGHPQTIDYLKRLGVTAVELLPTHAFVRDRYLVDQELTNYWGYNTLAFFAPDRAYLSDGTLGQIKWAIKQLHAAGIEVILDVVYNHTCEGNELGPTLSLRGLDNAAYYRLLPNNLRHYINDTGCGNTVNLSHPATIRLVMDSLRHWVREFHVDGFRFDLGVTLGREPSGFDPGAGFFDALMQDPLLARVKLISEPWDIGPGGYQIGNHPAGMAEWNGKFRDDVRRYWKGDAGLRPALAARLQGSAEMFDHHRRRPWASVNFVTAHDGFTLEDLVSYNGKHNEANGENNRDGSDHNDSSNWGVEGPTDDAGIVAQRERVKRAMLGTLLISHGTPMLLAGDEFGQTQKGNNNAYCQDNELSWLDWSRLDDPRGAALRDFVAQMLALRREQPLLQGLQFQHARVELAPGLRDVFWFDEDGVELSADDWNNPNARLLGLRRAGLRGGNEREIDVVIALFNADGDSYRFELPPPALDYRLLIDTADPQRRELRLVDGGVEIAGHSLMLLGARVERAALTALPAGAPAAANEGEPPAPENDESEQAA